MPHPSVTVVIPTLNESENLRWVLPRLDPDWEILLVDGHSTDDTIEVARSLRPDVKIIEQTLPGKGASLISGLLAASGDVIVMIDADASMDPVEIHSYIGLIKSGVDVVKGSRYAPGAGSEDLTTLRSLGNAGLRALGNLLYRQGWSELCYGFAAFSRPALHQLELDRLLSHEDNGPLPSLFSRLLGGARGVGYGHGFEIEAILFTRSVRTGLRVAEVPTYERERIFGTTNLSTFRDGFRVLTALLYERRWSVWSSRRRYEFPSRPDLATSEPSQKQAS